MRGEVATDRLQHKQLAFTIASSVVHILLCRQMLSTVNNIASFGHIGTIIDGIVNTLHSVIGRADVMDGGGICRATAQTGGEIVGGHIAVPMHVYVMA